MAEQARAHAGRAGEAGGAGPTRTLPPLRSAEARILDIQRTAGNRAMVGLMTRGGSQPRPLPPAASPPVPTVVMRARLPSEADLRTLLTGGANQAALTAGVQRLVQDALSGLPVTQQLQVIGRAANGLTLTQLAALPAPELQRRLAEGVRQVRPDRALGDVNQYQSSLRSGPDRARLALLLANTDQLFADILSHARLNQWITEIFGAGQHRRVLRRLGRARRGLQAAGRRRSISSDLSGYSEEVGLGGWATFQTHISLERVAVMNPADFNSMQLTLHEAMHFGTASVGDTVYLENSSDFTTLATGDKVNNAAHYEVLALRVRSPGDALAFPPPHHVFTPATSTGPGATMTPADEGRRFANRRYRDAWSTSIDLWEDLRRVHLRPTRWGRARRYLPFWSATEALTIHDRTIRTRGRPDEAPVTLIDLALAENFTHKLRRPWTVLRSSPAATIEAAHASPAERAAATTANQHRDLLVKCALRAEGVSLTGTVDRDSEVVRLLEAGGITRPRDPATAPPP